MADLLGIRSQIRNKIANHEEGEYTYIFDHFDSYQHERAKRQEAIDRINEMERWLNEQVQKAISKVPQCQLMNPYAGGGWISRTEKEKRRFFRTQDARNKIEGIVKELETELNVFSNGPAIGLNGRRQL